MQNFGSSKPHTLEIYSTLWDVEPVNPKFKYLTKKKRLSHLGRVLLKILLTWVNSKSSESSFHIYIMWLLRWNQR